MRVLIAGGGTGGHVIPALAIARELRDTHGAEVRFAGTARGLETRLVPEAGFSLELVRSGQLKNVSLATRARTLVDLPLGVLECVRLIRGFRPEVVVGVGGYASGPGMLAALLLRVPTLAFEPNAVPGFTNRLVGRWVSAAAVNFEETRRYFRNGRVTGVPVRQEFFAIAERDRAASDEGGGSLRTLPLTERPAARVRLLVSGGSQGARVFNAVMPKIAKALLDYVPGLEILHQAGARSGEATAEAYRSSGADAARWEVREFLDDMPRRFAEADLILCRSGASTVAELAAAGRAAVLVPFPGAADDHQVKNAEILAGAGAAELRRQEPDDSLMGGFLLSDLSALLLNPDRRAEMGRRVRGFAHPDAGSAIAALVLGLADRV
ncbi:MAG: undecaprenyldiphospho-muramoylpentapeptide beta-N-acetylglucosaminyltransferase [Acidobacteriota bacterium]|nr:undecaprenyldiphospho-muramoylpentapeptide beta-N-acetylglucosaminyltransferase [Acidobacteriota bacterium]